MAEGFGVQRLGSVGVTDHPDQSIDIGVKCGFTLGYPVGHGVLP